MVVIHNVMNQEVEIRVIIKNPAQIEEQLLMVGKFIKSRKQIDKYFVPPQKDYFAIKPTIEYLRVRYENGKNHLNYSFCHLDKNNCLISTDEYETTIEKPEIAEQILKKMGMIHKVTVTKTRKYFEIQNFEVTLDHIDELGDFMEIEAKKDFGNINKTRQACFQLLEKLGVDYKKCPEMGYPDMLIEKAKKS